VDKNQLASLLSHFSGSSSQEAMEINTLVKEYPYSQLLKTLAARVSKDHQLSNHQVALQQAAVYSTDRAVLKEIMSVIAEVTDYIEAAAKKGGLEKLIIIPSNQPEHDYADELIHDLERLQELKQNFEALFDQEGVAIPQIKAKPASEPLKRISKKERIIQMAKELDQKDQSESTPATSAMQAGGEKKKSSKKTADLDPIVNEIKVSRKKVQPESDKTREQIEIIDQFIKTKPNLTPASTSSEENPDLASTLKSGEFGDNIVSETLAEILIRQGKKDKAIEVYKKLIWKFPQKKAYFAAQIEELRK